MNITWHRNNQIALGRSSSTTYRPRVKVTSASFYRRNPVGEAET